MPPHPEFPNRISNLKTGSDMERQKLLWILFAVTVFLFVVITVGIVWFLPEEDKALLVGSGADGDGTRGSAAAEESEFDAIEWVRESEVFPDFEEKPADTTEPREFVIVYGEDDGSGDDGKTESPMPAPEITVDTDGLSDAAETPARPVPAKVEQPAMKAPAATASRPVQAAPPPEKAPAPRTVRVTEYWIQAGSFSTQARAESAREMLQNKGFTFRIFTKEIGGEITYRLRMGPYDAYAEAEKFLAWVKRLEQFSDSYISRVYTQRTVN